MIQGEQIERFFKKQCTAEEARQVADWLKHHPEQASAYLEENEWLQSPYNESPHEDVYQEVWQNINNKIRSKKQRILFQRIAVAACIAGGIVACLIYLNRDIAVPQQAISPETLIVAATITDTEYNHTNKVRRILLEDSSIVSLSPKAVIWFDTPFAAQHRDIHLTGEARFKVTGNKQKPFTVFAGALATTALGTEFTVKQQSNSIKIQLIRGKVIVKAVSRTLKNWENVYLLPGQQLIYNSNDLHPTITPVQDKRKDALKQAPPQNNQSETMDNLVFNGTSLNDVLQKIRAYYGVDIQFTESELQNMSFTGVISKKDAVQNILQVLARMNGLTIEESNNGFIISKSKTNDPHP